MKKILRTVSGIGSHTVDLIFDEDDDAEIVAIGKGFEVFADRDDPGKKIVAVEVDLDRVNLNDLRDEVPATYFAAIEDFFHSK